MKSVICVLFLASCTLAALTPEQIAKLEPISKQCRAESGATLEQVNKLRNNAVVEEDPKIKKQLLCVAQKAGLISESGEINVEAFKNNLKKTGASDQKIGEIAECLTQGTSPEDTAWAVTKCIYSKQPNYSPAD